MTSTSLGPKDERRAVCDRYQNDSPGGPGAPGGPMGPGGPIGPAAPLAPGMPTPFKQLSNTTLRHT